MGWDNFVYFFIGASFLWCVATAIPFVFKKWAKAGVWIGLAGSVVLFLFIVSLWQSLERPPFRTLGETRLWYSFFLSLTGIFIFWRWNFKMLLTYCLFLSVLFLFINQLKPETHDKTLMPALQSPWFIPHVVVYMVAYALLGASSLVAAYSIWIRRIKTEFGNALQLADTLVIIGFGFLSLGLLFGALWAKQAWGHYWTWDPKETWAFLTWLVYLIYMHLRKYQPQGQVKYLWILALAFLVLLLCWFGINYLPTAKFSVHTYS